jgi:isoleucyl-tRNA synthetase
VLNPQQRRDIQAVQDVICEELNVKEIEFVHDDAGIVKRSAKANFKVMGKKYGKDMKDAANVIRTFTNDDVRTVQRGTGITITVNSTEYSVMLEDIEILSEDIEGWLVASEGETTVALDTELTSELISEGIAREFVNRVQNIRKSNGFEVTDRINISFSTESTEIKSALQAMSEYICAETLAVTVSQTAALHGENVELNDVVVVIRVEGV